MGLLPVKGTNPFSLLELFLMFSMLIFPMANLPWEFQGIIDTAYLLQRAVQKWNSLENLSFAINFGDIVDGFCPKDQSLTTVKKVVCEFEKSNGTVYHMIGNHCLYNLPRKDLLPLLKISSHNNGCAYYDFSPTPEYRFVVLDGYDVSAIGWPQDHPNTAEALKFLNEKNPNPDKNSPDGLVGPERRFLKFNGGIEKEQLAWFDGVLQDATRLKQKVVICCHLALHPRASSFEALLWNYEEVADIIHKYKCVKACQAGHDHKGGYTVDSHGIHHRVFEAALECPPSSDAFGYLKFMRTYYHLLAPTAASRWRLAPEETTVSQVIHPFIPLLPSFLSRVRYI